MQVKSVKFVGNDNILRYAIKNKADILDDLDLLDFISTDMGLRVVLSDVNFYELFRLSHHYRKELMVIEEERFGEISQEEFSSIFPGEFKHTGNGETIKTSEIVKTACDGFMNLALQMESDEDIIPRWGARLFIPMIYRRFTISVPLLFYQFVQFISGTKLCDVFKDENYQKNTEDGLFTEDGLSVLNKILIYYSNVISLDIDHERVIQFAKVFYFHNLGENKTKKLYHFTPVEFSKVNEFTNTEQKIVIFNANPETISTEMKALASLNSPLKVRFAAHLTLQQLQALERTFSESELGVDFISTPMEIIGNKIRFEDFIVPEFDEESEERDRVMVEHEASVSAYRERIKSATENAFAVLAILANSSRSDASVDGKSCYGASVVVNLPPAIATSRAILTLTTSNRAKYESVQDELNKSMLSEMLQTMDDIQESITSSES